MVIPAFDPPTHGKVKGKSCLTRREGEARIQSPFTCMPTTIPSSLDWDGDRSGSQSNEYGSRATNPQANKLRGYHSIKKGTVPPDQTAWVGNPAPGSLSGERP